jgi:hypothetical protein
MKRAMSGRRSGALLGAVLIGALAAGSPLQAQAGRGSADAARDTTGAGGAPSLRVLMQAAATDSELRVAVRVFQLDRQVLRQRHDVPLSPARIARERAFHDGWLRELEAFDASALNEAGRAQHAVLRDTIVAGLAELDAQERQARAMAPLLPFVRPLQLLQENRRERLDVDARQAAQTVEDARKQVLRLTSAVDGARAGGSPEFRSITPEIAEQTVEYIGMLRSVLNNWYSYYYSFDPLFTWWVRMPYEELDAALDAYVLALGREWPAR